MEYFITFVKDDYCLIAEDDYCLIAEDDYCLIAEDDISFEYLKCWKKNFWDYINEVKEFDIIQLSQIYSFNKIRKYKIKYEDVKVINHERNFYGCGCYLITKKGAKKNN